MKLSCRPELMLFDLDGTLAHTVPQLALAAQQTARELQLTPPSLEAVAHFVGNGVMMLLTRTICGRFDVTLNDVDAALLARAREIFNQRYLAGLNANFSVYPGVKDGLEQFNRLGIKCAVVTNKPQMFATPLIRLMGLEPYFAYILGGEVLAVRKPDPAPLLYVCSKLQIAPEHALMVGDSVNDIQAGQRAGMATVAFSYGYNGGHDVREFKPDYALDAFAELTALIVNLPASAQS